MHLLVSMLLATLVTELASGQTPGASQPTRSTLIIGFLDGGWPGPSGEGSPSERFVISAAAAPLCQPSVDSARTDSGGRFRIVVPATVKPPWKLCIAITPRSDPIYPVFIYRGRGVDSLHLYCRGHGPASGPICQYVPWGSAFRWRGGETFDSLLEPPN
ncbi:MAG TPA: hypothetical protein VJ650_15015 [Gemmatimonadaceae bacterium]|nr:hypothetical protein [Gemmatimonadaceae bacterium]